MLADFSFLISTNLYRVGQVVSISLDRSALIRPEETGGVAPRRTRESEKASPLHGPGLQAELEQCLAVRKAASTQPELRPVARAKNT